MTFEIAKALFGLGSIASLALTLRAMASHPWQMMWAAAVASLLVSAVTIFSIGAIVFLLTCLQLASAMAMRRKASGREWLGWLALAVFVWCIVVPVQLISPAWSPGFGILVLVGFIGLLLPLLPSAKSRSP
jgi:hypothetical protein